MIADHVLDGWCLDPTLDKRAQLESRQHQRQHRLGRKQSVGHVHRQRVRQLGGAAIPADGGRWPGAANLARARETLALAQRTECAGILDGRIRFVQQLDH